MKTMQDNDYQKNRYYWDKHKFPHMHPGIKAAHRWQRQRLQPTTHDANTTRYFGAPHDSKSEY